MTEMEKLAQYALNPTAYGDDVRIDIPENGGMILTCLHRDQEMVLDPDQVRELTLRLSIDPTEAARELARLIISRDQNDKAGSALAIAFIMITGPMCLITFVLGALLF